MINDRDKALYGLHGRDDIIRDVTKALKYAMSHSSGTILIIQGPPGVGKTALLIELSRIANKEMGWRVVEIDSGALVSASELADAAGIDAAFSETRSGEGKAALELGGMGAKAQVGAGVERSRTFAGANPSEVLKRMAQYKKGTLLVMDEAQDVGRIVQRSEAECQKARSALRLILGGRCGGPVLLLAGGLGHTKYQFGELGISRFHGEAITNLDRVSDVAARSIIRGWLSQGTNVRAIAKGYDELVDAVVDRSHGWPHHIASYGAAAVEVVGPGRRRTLPPEVRKRILERGDQLRMKYYAERADFAKIQRKERYVFGQLIEQSGVNAAWDEDVLDSIAQRIEGGSGKGEHFMQRAIAKGILALQPDGDYIIPVPSMAKWLVRQSHNYAVKAPRKAQAIAGIVSEELSELTG